MSRKSWLWFIPFSVLALIATAVLFTLAWWLASAQTGSVQIFDTVDVSLVTLPQPEIPEPEIVRKPEKPEPEPKLDFQPDLLPPSLISPTEIGMDLVIDLGDVRSDDLNRADFVFEAGDLDQAPQVVVRVPPAYPFKARQREIEGSVRVRLLVKADGTVGEVIILEAKPEGLFEQSVLNSAQQWKFQPGKIGGQEVTAWVVTTIRFDLN